MKNNQKNKTAEQEEKGNTDTILFISTKLIFIV